MEKFTTLRSVAAPLPQDNIDTDIIYPARFLLITDRDGLDRYGFHDWRFDAQGEEKPAFPMAREPWRDARIMVTGTNFGCGSSREHAPWALVDMGIRAIIAPSFGEIFYGNCFKNGMLPIVVGEQDYALLMQDAEQGRTLEIDLEACEIRRDGDTIAFCVDEEKRAALINGWDEVETILAQNGEDISRFEAGQRASQPWLWAREQRGVANG